MTARISAKIIDGKAFAAGLRARLAARVPSFVAQAGRAPGLAVVLVGEDPASQVYVRSKHKATLEAGMQSFEHRLPAATSQQDLLDLVAALNADNSVDGILVQLPLPGHIDDKAVLAAADFKEPDWEARKDLTKTRAKDAAKKHAKEGGSGSDKKIRASLYVVPPVALGEEGSEGGPIHLLRRFGSISAHVFACLLGRKKMGALETNFLLGGILLGFTVFGTYLYNINALMARAEDRTRWK